uniref:Uncharacterized protein n=1 Tax=Arundo donax TaxID=35708 RepID=A0A0A9FDN0_ARUDO
MLSSRTSCKAPLIQNPSRQLLGLPPHPWLPPPVRLRRKTECSCLPLQLEALDFLLKALHPASLFIIARIRSPTTDKGSGRLTPSKGFSRPLPAKSPELSLLQVLKVRSHPPPKLNMATRVCYGIISQSNPISCLGMVCGQCGLSKHIVCSIGLVIA